MKNSVLKNIFIFIIAILFIASIFSLYNVSTEEIETISIQKMVEQINNEEVKAIVVRGNMLELTLTDEAETKQELQKEITESLSTLLSNLEVPSDKIAKINIEVKEETGFKFWAGALLPFLIPLIFIVAFIWFMMRQVQVLIQRQ